MALVHSFAPQHTLVVKKKEDRYLNQLAKSWSSQTSSSREGGNRASIGQDSPDGDLWDGTAEQHGDVHA
jgi:hypothetical protein